MVLIFFVMWGCVGWGIVCYCAIKAGARRHAMESAHQEKSMASDIDYNDPWGSKAGEEQYNVAKEHGLVTAKRGGNYDQFFDQDIPDDRPFKQRISPAVPVRHIQTRYDIALNKPGRTEPVDASETVASTYIN